MYIELLSSRHLKSSQVVQILAPLPSLLQHFLCPKKFILKSSFPRLLIQPLSLYYFFVLFNFISLFYSFKFSRLNSCRVNAEWEREGSNSKRGIECGGGNKIQYYGWIEPQRYGKLSRSAHTKRFVCSPVSHYRFVLLHCDLIVFKSKFCCRCL